MAHISDDWVKVTVCEGEGDEAIAVWVDGVPVEILNVGERKVTEDGKEFFEIWVKREGLKKCQKKVIRN